MVHSHRNFPQFASLTLGAACAGSLVQACVNSPPPPPTTTRADAPVATPQPGAAAPPTAAPAARTGALPKLVVSYPGPGAVFAPPWMAKAAGGFEKYGVSVDMHVIELSLAVARMLGPPGPGGTLSRRVVASDQRPLSSV
jgi:hypothetical protein